MLIDLYLLGFTIADVALRNTAIREMSKNLMTCNLMLSQSSIGVVWTATKDGDSMRRLLLDFVVAKGDREALVRLLAQYHSAFVHDLALAAVSKILIAGWQPSITEYLVQE
jgi:hypothetical protein